MTAPRRFVASALLAVVCACAGNPGPGESGYAFNVSGTYSGQFVVDGQGVSATLTLQTAPGGVVTGEVRVTEMGITAPAEGTVVASQLHLRIAYRNPGNGCDGLAEATATIGEGGATFSGPATITECGQAIGASMSFRR